MFEWDADKNRRNAIKHGVSFELAARIFDGPILTARDGRTDYGEVRSISIGAVGTIVVLAVVHTDRSGITRIISARRANRVERRRYEEAIRDGNDA